MQRDMHACAQEACVRSKIGEWLHMAMPSSELDGNPRSYADYMNEISGEELYEGLVGHGLIGEKLPPVFTSEHFLDYCKEKTHNFSINSRSGHGFVAYKCARNHKAYRVFGIPTPMAYENLCSKLRNNWNKIQDYFKRMTDSQDYKVSRIHIRKIRDGRKGLFDMNYKNWRLDGDPIPDILLGARYCVSTDISKCFPSIYTHAVEWALAGKEEVKERRKQKKKGKGLWESEIDSALAKTTNNETHGILIGPHASNLVSEMILCRVDSELSGKWRYVRHVDDVDCYVSSREEADAFIRDFDKALMKYGLTRNTTKTRVLELPYGLQSKWVRAIRRYPLPIERPLWYTDISAYLDYVIDLERSEDNLAVFAYALQTISDCRMTQNASAYLLKVFGHLASVHPYLIARLEAVMTNAGRIDRTLLKKVSDAVYTRSIKEGNYYSAYFALYFAAKYKFELDEYNNAAVIDSDDCLLKFFALIYCRKKNKTKWISALKDNARSLEASGDFESNWVFCYEALNSDELPSDDWKGIKNKRVSFYDSAAFEVNDDAKALLK